MTYRKQLWKLCHKMILFTLRRSVLFFTFPVVKNGGKIIGKNREVMALWHLFWGWKFLSCQKLECYLLLIRIQLYFQKFMDLKLFHYLESLIMPPKLLKPNLSPPKKLSYHFHTLKLTFILTQFYSTWILTTTTVEETIHRQKKRREKKKRCTISLLP